MLSAHDDHLPAGPHAVGVPAEGRVGDPLPRAGSRIVGDTTLVLLAAAPAAPHQRLPLGPQGDRRRAIAGRQPPPGVGPRVVRRVDHAPGQHLLAGPHRDLPGLLHLRRIRGDRQVAPGVGGRVVGSADTARRGAFRDVPAVQQELLARPHGETVEVRRDRRRRQALPGADPRPLRLGRRRRRLGGRRRGGRRDRRSFRRRRCRGCASATARDAVAVAAVARDHEDDGGDRDDNGDAGGDQGGQPPRADAGTGQPRANPADAGAKRARSNGHACLPLEPQRIGDRSGRAIRHTLVPADTGWCAACEGSDRA